MTGPIAVAAHMSVTTVAATAAQGTTGVRPPGVPTGTTGWVDAGTSGSAQSSGAAASSTAASRDGAGGLGGPTTVAAAAFVESVASMAVV